MKLKITLLLNFILVFLALFDLPANADSESCIECHLHRSITEGATDSGREADSLAAFHVREFESSESLSGCRKCHGQRQSLGKLPAADVCTSCHTRGKASQGDPDRVFHAEKNHWPMDKVSCTGCHKAHIKGNADIKFLTADAIGVCGTCHEKSFGATVSAIN